MIESFNDFCQAIHKAGFSMGSPNDEGIFSVGKDYSPRLEAHTGDPETDPWEWRMRVLEENKDLAYGKVFFKKAGFISKETYPYFLASRRGHASCQELYEAGKLSYQAKEIYDLIKDQPHLAAHEIRPLTGLDKKEVDKALVELQMLLMITMSGRKRKINKKGEPYGWAVVTYVAVEDFWPKSLFDKANSISPEEGKAYLLKSIKELGSAAPEKKIDRFIRGY